MFIGLISPLRGSGEIGEREENIRQALLWAMPIRERGDMPVVPHTFFSRVLDDNIPLHREVGMNCGRQLYRLCNEIQVRDFGKGISAGMEGDIAYCQSKGLPLVYPEKKEEGK